MNNFDRIKQMNIDEMSQFMFDLVDCISCKNKLKRADDECHGDGGKCLKVTKRWLRNEYKGSSYKI